MSPRAFVYAIVAMLAGVALLIGGGGVWVAYEAISASAAAPTRLIVFALAAGLLLSITLGAAWWFLETRLLRPLQRLAGDAHTVAHSTAEAPISLPGPHALGEIASTTAELAERMVRMRRDTVRAMGAAAAQVERQSNLLEAVLLDLSEGVIVCGLDHRILMYNRAAVWFVDAPDHLGLGRSVFELVEQDAILEALNDLMARWQDQPAGDGPGGALSDELTCTTVTAGTALSGHMALVRDHTDQTIGYVITIHERRGGGAEKLAARTETLPPRPEFYDFDLMDGAPPTGTLAEARLADLSYVVFDTETTGLRPSEGDEIISIAGIRIVNRRILSRETFERLVNPERPIPKSSVRFHGITDDMVRDRPTIAEVLPDFRRFVGDSVLVAHNAAFDMKFLSLKQGAAGVSFDLPVLDTLLLSVYLHDHVPDHTLDGMASRFGIEVIDRHTALGDARLTANILLHLLELLEARGVTTFGRALAVSQAIVGVRRRQEQY